MKNRNAGQKAQVTELVVKVWVEGSNLSKLDVSICKKTTEGRTQNPPLISFYLNFTCFPDQSSATVASHSSLIWERSAVTAEYNHTTHTHTDLCRTHTHTHSPSSGKQERSSCELHSSVQIEGDTGKLVNRHRCTELSRTESGRKRKVTLSQWEGTDKVNNTCCMTKATL